MVKAEPHANYHVKEVGGFDCLVTNRSYPFLRECYPFPEATVLICDEQEVQQMLDRMTIIREVSATALQKSKWQLMNLKVEDAAIVREAMSN